jgi:hypothetical protein
MRASAGRGGAAQGLQGGAFALRMEPLHAQRVNSAAGVEAADEVRWVEWLAVTLL